MITRRQANQFGKLVEDAVRSLGLSKDAAQRVLSSKELQPRMKEVIRALAQGAIASLADLIAAGKYDWVDNNITQEHFPVSGQTSEAEPVLVHLGHTASTDEVLRYMDERGLRPGTAEEILAFGAKNPEEQRKYPIVALASVWVHPDGDRRVVYLGSDGRERYLGLGWCDDDWIASCRFLAFRK